MRSGSRRKRAGGASGTARTDPGRRVGTAVGAAMLAIAGAMLIAAILWLTGVPGGQRAGGPPARVLIPKRTTFRGAADSLAVAGLIRWPRLFSLYGSLNGRDRGIRAGTYRLARGQSWSMLIDALHTGKGVVATITIPEGWPLRRIIPYLSRELQIPVDSLQAAVRDSALRARLAVPAETLEGYLFPDTYVIALGTTARQAVALLATRFEQVWRPEWNARLDTMHRTRHEVVTLASIVETEVKRNEERPVVAAVYWNRLRGNMALQADPTILYALGKSGTHVYYSDLDVKSPYNTYRHTGLPPGPIASPGIESIDAALHPARVSYRYFVAAPDGHHEFRTTFAEHETAILRLRADARADSIRKARAADSVARGGAPPVTPSRGRGGA
jgi:UPF0755 protein